MMSVTVIPEQLTVAKSSTAFSATGRLVRAEDVAGLQAVAAALAQAAVLKQEAAV